MFNLYDILTDITGKRERINENGATPGDVVDAINKKVMVKIHYDDGENHKTGTRFIEPFAYGISKAGNDVLRAFQVEAGPNGTLRGAPKWKLFRLDRIQDWRPTKTTFELTPDEAGWANAMYFNRNGDRSMVSVKAIIDMPQHDTLDIERAKTKMLTKGRAFNFNSKRMEGDLPVGFRRRKKYIGKNKTAMLNRNMQISGPVDSKQKFADYDRMMGLAQQETPGPIIGKDADKNIADMLNLQYSEEEMRKKFPEYFGNEEENNEENGQA